MDEHIEKVVAQMVKYPANFGHHCELPLYKPGGYGNTGISINRDSDALERSNWRVIVRHISPEKVGQAVLRAQLAQMIEWAKVGDQSEEAQP